MVSLLMVGVASDRVEKVVALHDFSKTAHPIVAHIFSSMAALCTNSVV